MRRLPDLTLPRAASSWLWAGILVLLLAACGALEALPAGTEHAYVATVGLTDADTPESIAATYGGEVIVWRPDADFAILGLPELDATTGAISRLGTLDPNAGSLSAAVASGVSAWAGGVSAWAGSYNAWAGGPNAWAGGTGTSYTTFLENVPLWNLVQLPQAQLLAPKLGAGVVVAVIDTGIDLDHPAFAGRLAPADQWYDFVEGDKRPDELNDRGSTRVGIGYGHGTAVAGIVLQVAPNAIILPLRVLNSDGVGDLVDVIAAIDHAVAMGAKVINLSLGSATSISSLNTIVRYATQRNVHLVASSGNTGDTRVTYPAADFADGSGDAKYRSISVGSVRADTRRSSFSTYGSRAEVSAPGEALVTFFPDGRLAKATGTSFAAPIASGALALGLGERLNSDEYGKLSMHVEATANDGQYNVFAFGLLQIEAFLRKAMGR